jgi:protein involved in polysaccharide export with SLBB domain
MIGQVAAALVCATTLVSGPVFAQGGAPGVQKEQSAQPAAVGLVGVPAEYVIGPEDVLGVVFWRDPDMTGDVTVRPDGKITLPLLGDLHAAGLTTVELKAEIEKARSTAAKFLSRARSPPPERFH